MVLLVLLLQQGEVSPSPSPSPPQSVLPEVVGSELAREILAALSTMRASSAVVVRVRWDL